MQQQTVTTFEENKNIFHCWWHFVRWHICSWHLGRWHFVRHSNAERLLPELQSAYRAHHSTETAVTKVLADILLALDAGDLSMLTLVDLSAAFNTVDHETLLRHLEVLYGLGGAVLSWSRSYLNGRTQPVRCGKSTSYPSSVTCGVPQGSVLGLILFLLYTVDLLRLIERHNLRPHAFCDDTQHQIHKVPMQLGEDLVVPAIIARDLGHVDAGATMRTYGVVLLRCTSADPQHSQLHSTAGGAISD